MSAPETPQTPATPEASATPDAAENGRGKSGADKAERTRQDNHLLSGIAAAENLLNARAHLDVEDLRRAIEQKHLTPLTVSARFIALSLSGTCEDGEDALGEATSAFAERKKALLTGADLIEQAVAGNVRDIRSLDRLWHDLRYGPPPVAFTVATTLALAGELPMGVTEPRHLITVVHPHLVGLVGLAAGAAAREGCGQARSLVLKTLSASDLSTRVREARLGILKGLGRGLVDDGFDWVHEQCRRTLSQRREWSLASRECAKLALTMRSEHAQDLVRQALLVATETEATVQLLEELAQFCIEEDRSTFLEELHAQWTRWPAPVRAAILRHLGLRLEADTNPWTSDRSATVALEALRQLRQLPTKDISEVLRSLLGLLDHPHPEVRRQLTTLVVAQRTLGQPRSLPTPSGAQIVSLPATLLARTELDRLRAAIFASDSEILEDIAYKLDEAERPTAVRELLAALEVPDMALRRSIVSIVGRIGTAELWEQLIDAARRFRTLEGLIADALRRLGAVDAVDALGGVFERRLKWADDHALADFCELAADRRGPFLLSAIETRFYPAARAGAARAIAGTRLQEGIFALRHMSLSDPQEDARLAATAGLKALGCSLPSSDELAGYALLFKPIASLDEAVERAIEAGSAAIPGIRTTLSKGSWKRRRAVCDVLAGLDDPEAEPTLVEILRDLDEDVRLSALQALSRRNWEPQSPHEHTLAAIAARQPVSLLKTPDRMDVATLERALELGGHVFRNEVLDVLERLEDWTPSVSTAAYMSVTRLDGRGATDQAHGFDALVNALDRTWQEIPHRARLTRALHELETADLDDLARRDDLGWRSREAMCRALCRPGDDAAAEAVASFVLDDDDDVRRSALQTLTQIGTMKAAEACSRGARSPFREDRKPAASALAAIGESALPILKRLARSPWWEERHLVASALQDWREDLLDAADILVVLATDPVHRVSQVAHEALEQHGIVPRIGARREALMRAQGTTIDRLEQWLLPGPSRSMNSAEACAELEKLLDGLPVEQLPQRLAIVAKLRATPMLDWLREKAISPHFGIRLAASEALRALTEMTCYVCEGPGSIGCPACEGAGEQVCETCDGSATARVPCPEPDCNAHATTRAIDSLPCKMCRGRGAIAAPCGSCVAGTVTCSLCHGSGRNRCPLCEGSGEPNPPHS